MGGEITYSCVGSNQFVFELVFYRDCNGAEVNIVSENLRVWNHPSVQNINLLYVSREDISPFCTSVVGGPVPLECGIGSAGGNGIGAIEKITYRSIPVTLNGIPPVEGWIFTYENFSRSSAITNLNSPSSYGITLAAKMFAVPGGDGSACSDSSPKFLQAPNFVSCAGSPYTYNMNAVDPDLDSLVFDFGIPYNYFPDATAYNPPLEPNPVPFESGFSQSNPTPDISFDAANVPADIDPLTGELTFLVNNIGNYVVKITVKSFRAGILISEVEREMQLVVNACSPNNSPIIDPPFSSNLFDTTIIAGEPVNFNLLASDYDLLQDGSNQSVILTASGPMFGTNFTQNTGCEIEPCAQLNNSLPIQANSSVAVDFTWQTTCDHLVNQYGIVADVVPYSFVFKVQDDFCQVPKVSYATVTIKVKNPGIIPETQISCIQTNQDGSIDVSWTPVSDVNQSFAAYNISSLQGLNNVENSISTSSTNFPAINSVNNFFIGVQSGCDGNVIQYSDTLKNIYLDLINPANGTAVLQWNAPYNASFMDSNLYYYIYREYPIGNTILIDSVLYGNNQYMDTIDICNALIGYQIVLPNGNCSFTSNIASDDFEDLITPEIPFIYAAGSDTSNLNNTLISWNLNSQEDTYGYIVYTFDENGFLFELDTVWGWENTYYSYPNDLSQNSYSYSVAAFDSCFTDATPPTYQTSAKAYINSTMLLESNILMCEKQVELNWTPYSGRNPDSYSVWSLSNGTWTNHVTVNDTLAVVDVVNGDTYCFLVAANFSDGTSAFSASNCFEVPNPSSPSFHYLRVSSVENQKVILKDFIDASVGVSAIVFERRKYLNGPYKVIGQVNVNGNENAFIDEDVDVDAFSYQYRAKYIDSCGIIHDVYSNINRTILVEGSSKEYNLENSISWNRYEGFDSGVQEYRIYRTLNGVFNEAPIATIANNNDNDEFYFFDEQLDNIVSNIESGELYDYTNGAICYKIEAYEQSENSFGYRDSAFSNELCLNYKPLVFIPNAFTPNGINPIFIPVITNVSEENYEFSILNRWGQEFFTTRNILEGWNGTIQGVQNAPNDVYVYLLRFEDQNGNKYFKKGMLTLLR